MNWSGITKSVGLCSSFSEPTAETETNPLHAQFLEGVDVGPEVQLRGQDAVSAPMPGQKGHLAPLQLAQHKGVGRLAKGRLHALFMHIRKSGHRVQPAAADNANLRLSQCTFLFS